MIHTIENKNKQSDVLGFLIPVDKSRDEINTGIIVKKGSGLVDSVIHLLENRFIAYEKQNSTFGENSEEVSIIKIPFQHIGIFYCHPFCEKFRLDEMCLSQIRDKVSLQAMHSRSNNSDSLEGWYNSLNFPSKVTPDEKDNLIELKKNANSNEPGAQKALDSAIVNLREKYGYPPILNEPDLAEYGPSCKIV